MTSRKGFRERRYLRMEVHRPATVYVYSKKLEGILKNISLCGAFVVLDYPAEMGMPVGLRFNLPNRDRTLSAEGRVTRIEPPVAEEGGRPDRPTGWGIEFERVREEHVAAIDEYVRQTFRAFRRLQFELSKMNPDSAIVAELLTQTYLRRTYTPESLKNVISAELKKFRLRGEEKMGK